MNNILALRIRLALLAALVALLAAPVSARDGASSEQPDQLAEGWIVQLKPGWTQFQGLAGVDGIFGDSSVRTLSSAPATYLAQFDGDTSAASSIARLAAHPAVEFVEPDILLRYQQEFIPNDQHFIHQEWARTVELPRAWAISGGREDLVVAILDSGIRADHPDLQGKVKQGYNVIDANTDTTDWIGHGTQVAGIVAATGDNSIGIAGAAMNVTLMPVKVGTANGARVSDIAAGIEFAVNNGAEVINLSLGSSSQSALLRQSVRYAYDNNVVVVAAAGNERNEVSFPGTEQEVISVGASTLNGQHVAGFSSRVSRVDLIAPGEDIATTAWSPENGNHYVLARGTSFSTPIVAGAVALLRSANPNLTVEEVRALLTGTARGDFQSDPSGSGAGLLDAHGALLKTLIPTYASTWLPADEPVTSLAAQRTWLWGPHSFDIRAEEYGEAEFGLRLVAYYDKSRMEITDLYADRGNAWFVTNGLLVNELITGQMQVGDDQFQQRQPANVPVAGDPDDPESPTYASFGGVLNAPAPEQGAPVTQTLSRGGVVGNNDSLVNYGVTSQEFIPETGHRIASVFWEYLNSSGTLRQNREYVVGPIFSPAFFATGFPVTDAYWARVRVGGVQQDVLIQCFERRCLTHTPGNDPGWRTEMGNVGQHYYRWRYGEEPAGAFAPDPSIYAMQVLR